MSQAREGYDAREHDEMLPTVDDGKYIIGIDDSNLTPLDALSERLRVGERWLQSDTVCEVRQ